jgi:hypothetical protein
MGAPAPARHLEGVPSGVTTHDFTIQRVSAFVKLGLTIRTYTQLRGSRVTHMAPGSPASNEPKCADSPFSLCASPPCTLLPLAPLHLMPMLLALRILLASHRPGDFTLLFCDCGGKIMQRFLILSPGEVSIFSRAAARNMPPLTSTNLSALFPTDKAQNRVGTD